MQGQRIFMDGREGEKGGGNARGENRRTISGGLYLNYLGSIHTWDKHCHPKGLSRRHLMGTLYTAGVPQEWKKPERLGAEGGARETFIR